MQAFRTYGISISHAPAHAKSKLFWRETTYERLLSAMYGNNPACWNNDLEGMERMRSIINYLTRMRLIDAVGELELTYDGPLDGIPKGYKAWFNFYRKTPPPTSRWCSDIGRRSTANATSTICHALDTGCVWGNALTALRLHDRERFSVDSVE